MAERQEKKRPVIKQWWDVVRSFKKFKVPAGTQKDIQYGYVAGYYAALWHLKDISRCPAELLRNLHEFYEAASEDLLDAEREFAERRGPIS